MTDAIFRVPLGDEAASVRLAEDIALRLQNGDVLALQGDLGAGKTTLARALIRALAGNYSLEVPSPTFTLVQTYAARLPVAHFDLYRLSGDGDLDEIGLDEAIGDGVVLIEWPERAGSRLPKEALTIALATDGNGRLATLSGGGDWPERLARSFAIRHFLDRSGFLRADRHHLQGDASTRRYERVAVDGRTAVLMDAPERQPGPPLPGGRTYDGVAHRATSVRPFVAMGEAIANAGLSAPALLSADLDAGMLLLEDLGTEGVLHDGEPDFERYAVAAEALALLHAHPRSGRLPLPDGSVHVVPPFDRDAFLIEAGLMPAWYAPLVLGRPLPDTAIAAFEAIWDGLFTIQDATEKSWLLRDFHSPNLLWLPHRHGVARIGILDHQDAMIGASAYDLASLGQDARVDIGEGFESALTARYVAARAAGGRFDEAGFAVAYAISGAQRNTKVLGGFARLAANGKSQYLRHIPRIRAYVRRNLTHEVLADLARWYQAWLPLDD